MKTIKGVYSLGIVNYNFVNSDQNKYSEECPKGYFPLHPEEDKEMYQKGFRYCNLDLEQRKRLLYFQ